MPLVKSTLQSALKTKIKNIEPKLKDVLDSKSKGLYKAQQQSDNRIKNLGIQTGFNISQYQQNVWTIISDEWSTVLAKEIIDILSKELSSIISDEVDKYIKSASIVVPAGQALIASVYAGTTVAPSPEANIS